MHLYFWRRRHRLAARSRFFGSDSKTNLIVDPVFHPLVSFGQVGTCVVVRDTHVCRMWENVNQEVNGYIII